MGSLDDIPEHCRKPIHDCLKREEHRSTEDVVGFAFCVGHHVKTTPGECIRPMMDVAKHMSKPHAPHPPAQSTQHGHGGHVLQPDQCITANMWEGNSDDLNQVGKYEKDGSGPLVMYTCDGRMQLVGGSKVCCKKS